MSENTKQDLLEALAEYDDSKEYEHYRDQEEVIVDIFSQYPSNNDKKSVLLKVCVLDSFYSTNLKIYGIHEVVEKILNLSIDKALKVGDTGVIEKIANFTNSKGKQAFLYSFASKYCFHHNKDKYVIFDSFVQKSLIHFNNKDKICSFKLSQNSLKNYENLLKAIKEIRTFYGLEEFNNRQMDHMLWVYGKENLK
ncbi:hypothetical protein [Helicobacter sp.]|uniref:hypothetical protein n=1 Tax=Helicobacter sp. TaxID=218 RepID=UPI00258758D1|nr:hypothetical protein [Helicobacter sp.]MCI7766021.1 hypothetical protein [Helicobacter sp.]